MSPDQLMTTEEVAEYLRTHVSTVHRWRWKKTGPRGSRVGRQILYRRSDVDAWLDSRAEVAA